jgi:hypothetical protein
MPDGDWSMKRAGNSMIRGVAEYYQADRFNDGFGWSEGGPNESFNNECLEGHESRKRVTR